VSGGAAAAPSLTARVLRRVLLPLGLTWLLGTAVALVVASYFAEQAFDRAMLDDAYSVSANVRAGERGVELLLSPREMNNLLFDQSETVYFAVLRPDGSLLAGDAGLRAPAPQEGARHRFSRIDHQGQALRAVVLNQSCRGPGRVRSSPGACGPRSSSTVSTASSGSPIPRCSSSRWWYFTTLRPVGFTNRTSPRSRSRLRASTMVASS